MKLIKRLQKLPAPRIDDPLKSFLNSILEGLKPEANLTFQQFCDSKVQIPKSTGGKHSGQYSSDLTPHVRKVMNCLDVSHPCRRVIVKGASQTWKTQTAINWLLYIVNLHPANILYLISSGTLHKRLVNRIDKTIKGNSCVNQLFAPPNSKVDQNNNSIKSFQGGTLFLGSSASASNLAETPSKYLIGDEVSRWPVDVGGEGSAVSLSEKRLTSFNDSKAYFFSSPTLKGECEISSLYDQGTQRKPLFECVHCGDYQELIFENMKFSDDAIAYYPCTKCGGIHYEHHKPQMFEKGLWSDGIPTDEKTESFTITALFLPYGSLSWTEVYKEYLIAKNDQDSKADSAKLIAFYNTRLAREWSAETSTTTAEILQEKAEDYQLGIIPHQCTYLTASVDTQGSRYEVCVYGWKHEIEGWIVDYQIIHGQPDDEETKKRLLAYLTKEFKHKSGKTLKINLTFMDSGGGYTTDVYDFCRKNKKFNIFPIKGSSTPTASMLPNKPKNIQFNYKGKPQAGGVKLFMLGTNVTKDFIFSRLVKKSSFGAIHFSKELPLSFFEGIVSEYRSKKTYLGRTVTTWIKKHGGDNEPLDLLVYALIAAFYLKLDQLPEASFKKQREKIGLDSLIEDAEIIEDKIEKTEKLNIEEEIFPELIKTLNSRVGNRPSRIRRNNNFNFSF